MVFHFVWLGRVHSAVVSGVDWTQRSVTVEWFEHGETKGKELPVEQILVLNPDLIPDPSSNNANNTVNNTTTTSNKPRAVRIKFCFKKKSELFDSINSVRCGIWTVFTLP